LDFRHPDVHQDHVRLRLAGGEDRREAVRGLADDLEARLGLEDHPEARAYERLVVGDQDLRHALLSSGRWALTTKPPPFRGPDSSEPPTSDTRSRSPAGPCPPLPPAPGSDR